MKLLHGHGPGVPIHRLFLALAIVAATACLPARAPGQERGAGVIGLAATSLTPEAAPVFGMGDSRGALVVGTLPDAPADLAGVKLGDVVRSLAGTPVADADDLVAIVRALPVGATTKMVLRRGGRDTSVVLKVGNAAALAAAQPAGTDEARLQAAAAAFQKQDPAAWSLNLDLARRGFSSAQNLVGIMKSIDVAGPPDPVQASWWFRLAAQQGDPSGQNNLAWQYWYGTGLPVDKVRAYYWMARAAMAGNPECITARDTIAAALQPAEMASAQAWLNWVPPPKPGPGSRPAATQAKPAAAGPKPYDVRRAQQELARLGYDVGAPDAVAGRRTVAAVKAFQRDAGLPVDGAITAGLLKALAKRPTPAAAPAAAQTPPATGAGPGTSEGLGDLGFPAGNLDIPE